MAKHSIKLTNGAAHLLSNLCSAPGMLTDPAQLFRVGEFAENHLTELAPEPKDVTQAEAKAWNRFVQPPVEISERVRDALKELVRVAISKGAIGGHPSVMALMRELGLAPEGD